MVQGKVEKTLAAGLKLPVVVQYCPQGEGRERGELLVLVDDKVHLTVPIVG